MSCPIVRRYRRVLGSTTSQDRTVSGPLIPEVHSSCTASKWLPYGKPSPGPTSRSRFDDLPCQNEIWNRRQLRPNSQGYLLGPRNRVQGQIDSVDQTFPTSFAEVSSQTKRNDIWDGVGVVTSSVPKQNPQFIHVLLEHLPDLVTFIVG